MRPMWIDEAMLLVDLPFRVDVASLARRLKVAGRPRFESDLDALAREAETVARPKALYGIAEVSLEGEDVTILGGTRFVSGTLRRALGGAPVAYPFVATCGAEMAAWGGSFGNLLRAYWADMLMEAALQAAEAALKAQIEARAGGRTASLRPGIPADWPVTGQRALFDLFGGAEGACGVSLTPDCLMLPLKSTSGLRFLSEKPGMRCELCGLERCMGRREPGADPDACEDIPEGCPEGEDA